MVENKYELVHKRNHDEPKHRLIDPTNNMWARIIIGTKVMGVEIFRQTVKREVLPGVEPRSLDSKSRVLTTTP